MYIIDQANVYSEEKQEYKKISFFIKNNIVHSVRPLYSKTRLIKMDVSPFVMTPTHVMLDTNIPCESFQSLKQYSIKNYLLKGCHTIITPFSIQYESQFDEELHRKRIALLNSPVDYVIALKAPIEKITPQMIRKCKKEKIAIILLEIKDIHSIQQIAWSWIREAMFPYNPILVPIISDYDASKKKVILKKWNEILDQDKVPRTIEEIHEKRPISIKNLKKFGLYPKRGDLNIGGEINYNLYFKNKKVAEQNPIHYDSDRLAIMIHKGRVTTTIGQAVFRPGFGEEILIRRTSLFV
ncbi:hypothetical protein ACQKCU_13155 [Heyndrickxia sporothermodurans]